MAEYKKGGLTGNSNLYATNRLFVKNPLFKKRKKKAPGVYSPTAKFRYKEGGTKDKSPAYIEKDLTREEIEKYRKGGYIVEEVNDPSIPALNRFDNGGSPKSQWIAPSERYSGRSNVDPTTKLIYKDFGDVDVKAGKKGFKNKVKSFFQKDIGKLTKEAEDLGKGVGYIAGVQGDIEPAVYNREGIKKFKSEVKRLKGDFNTELKDAEKKRKQEAKDREDYEQARKKAQSSKDPNAGSNFARKYEEKGWSKFDQATMKEGSKGQFQDAVDEANARKEANMGVTNTALELLGGGAYRIIEDPIGTAKGVGNTVADLAMTSMPVTAAFGARDPNINPLTGNEYWSGLGKTFDVIGAIPGIGAAGKLAKFTKAGDLASDIGKGVKTFGTKIKSNTTFYKSKNTGTNTSTGLTEADIATARAEEKAWITSDEYLKRRMTNTGETAEQIKKDVDAIVKRADKATYNVNANINTQGSMSTGLSINPINRPVVSVTPKAYAPKMVLRHENIHLYSPTSAKQNIFTKDLHKNWDHPNVAQLPASKRGVYANYPILGDSPNSGMYGPSNSKIAVGTNADYHYNMLGQEQQARHLGAMRDVAAKNNVNLNAGEKLTEGQVRSHMEDWLNTRKNVDYDYDKIWGAELLNEREKLAKAYGSTFDELETANPTKWEEIRQLSKDNVAKTITNTLNKAWVVAPTVGVAGTAAMLTNPFEGSDGLQQQKKGGSTTDAIEIDIPKEEIQWYIDNGYIVEPVSKLKKFIG